MASESIKRLQRIDEYEFEEFVADLWERRDWSTEVTTASRDRGIDIIATRESPFPEKQLIQAKYYSNDNKVGSPEIQRYASLHRQEENVDSVVVVTTGDFTQQAREVANDLNVKLIDGRSLAELILDRGFEDLVEKHCSVASQSSDSSERITNTIQESQHFQESQHSDDIVDLEIPKETSNDVPNHVVQLRSTDLTDEMMERMKLGAAFSFSLNEFMNSPEESNNRGKYLNYRDQILTKCDQTDEFVEKLRSIPTDDMPLDYEQRFQENIELWEDWASANLQLIESIDEIIDEEKGGIRCPECTAQMKGDLGHCSQCGAELAELEDSVKRSIEILDRISNINKEIRNNTEKMTSHLDASDAERGGKMSVVERLEDGGIASRNSGSSQYSPDEISVLFMLTSLLMIFAVPLSLVHSLVTLSFYSYQLLFPAIILTMLIIEWVD